VNDTTRSDDERNVSEINVAVVDERSKSPGAGSISGYTVDLHAGSNPVHCLTSVKPISEWGPSCATGFVRNAMFGPGQVIAGTNRNKSRANRRLVDWQGAK
jgi:hypothetical protein